MAEIFIFGASVECGAWDKEGGWVERLKKSLYSEVIKSKYKKYFIVYNLGIDGGDSRGILKRIISESKRRMWPDSENIFIISAGANDSLLSLRTGKTKISLKDYENNLRAIVKLVKKYSRKIVLKSPLPINQSLVDPVPWLPDYAYKSKLIEERKKIMAKVAREEKIFFINLYDRNNNSNWSKLLMDGVHPSTKGHEKIYRQVKEFLVDNKII